MSSDQCPVCGAPRAVEDEVCARCSWDFSPVLTGDPHRPEDQLEQAQRVWQAAVAWHATGEARARAAGSSVTALAGSASKTFTNSFGMEFILIPAGAFTMGDVFEGAFDNESPLHRVKISQPFYLGKYAVTQEQWAVVMGKNPSKFKGRNNPVETVSWDEVQTFIQGLNEQEGANKYRLPTEAEWEYAARVGTTGAYSFGDDADQLEQYAWSRDNSGRQTHPVGQKKSNSWGLYDMHGNVWEWMQDWYGAYSQGAVTDPIGPSEGEFRVVRGGSWFDSARLLRSAGRNIGAPDYRSEFIGFRLALSPRSLNQQAQ